MCVSQWDMMGMNGPFSDYTQQLLYCMLFICIYGFLLSPSLPSPPPIFLIAPVNQMTLMPCYKSHTQLFINISTIHPGLDFFSLSKSALAEGGVLLRSRKKTKNKAEWDKLQARKGRADVLNENTLRLKSSVRYQPFSYQASFLIKGNTQ